MESRATGSAGLAVLGGSPLEKQRGDQIIGEGLGEILANNQDLQAAFDAAAVTLTEQAKPVIEALKAIS